MYTTRKWLLDYLNHISVGACITICCVTVRLIFTLVSETQQN